MADGSVWWQIMVAMRNRILALNLAGILENEVVVRKLPWDRNRAYPGISIHPEPEINKFVTNKSDDVGYGVQVVMVQASNQDLETNMDRILQWRQSIRQELSGDRFSEVSGGDVWSVEVTPGVVFLPEAFAKGYDVGALLCRVTTRELVR